MDIDNLFAQIPEVEQTNEKVQKTNKDKKNKKLVQKSKKINANSMSSELRNELLKLELVKLTSENLYQRFPNLLSTPQFDNDRTKYQICSMIGDGQFYDDKIEQKNFLLGRFEKPFQILNKNEQEDKGILNNYVAPIKKNFKRQQKVFKIKDITYKSIEGMNKLWNLYVQDLISKEKQQESIYNRLLKMDFHGALLQVCQAKCKSYEGQEGIVINEKRRSFTIINRQDRKISIDNSYVVLLKENAVFLLPIDNKIYKLYGCHLCIRPCDRIKTQFKQHKANSYLYSIL